MRTSAVRLAVAGLAVAGAAALPATAAMAAGTGHHEGNGTRVTTAAAPAGHYDGGARPATAAKPMPNEWSTRQSAGDDAPDGTRVTSVAPAGHHETSGTKAAADDTCYYGQFCTYANSNYTHIVDRVSSCTWHRSHAWFASYVNNQTPGTVARFYHYGTPPVYEGSSPPAPSRTTTYYGDAYYIRPC